MSFCGMILIAFFGEILRRIQIEKARSRRPGKDWN